MSEIRAMSPAARLEAAYTRIWKTRMQGLPFLNENLRVEAVGFRAWEGQWLGALVTPWSMNLVILPGEGPWTCLPKGAERFVALPAGRYRFVAGLDEELGEHHDCSLFSPAQEFADHETARAVAAAALEALFDAGNAEAPDSDGSRGTVIPPPGEPAAVSKRDFLRGRFSGTAHGDRG
jgi:[NiFe] hydrogenase assembly HybE family chaperone